MVYNVFSAEWFTLHLMVAGLQVNNSTNYNYELGISTPKRRTKSHLISRRQCILVAHITTFSVLTCYLFHTLIRFIKCIKSKKCTLILIITIQFICCSYILLNYITYCVSIILCLTAIYMQRKKCWFGSNLPRTPGDTAVNRVKTSHDTIQPLHIYIYIYIYI